jgi:hypothetical protein
MRQATRPDTTIPTRRALLAGAPAVAAAALAAGGIANSLAVSAAEKPLSGLAPSLAAASEVDPIFAVIAEHRQAVKAEARALEDTFGFGGGPAEEPEDSPAHVAAEERHSTASDRTQAAVWKLVEIEPTSAAGLRALMQYVVAIEPGLQWPPGWEREFHKACLRSTEALIDGVRT